MGQRKKRSPKREREKVCEQKGVEVQTGGKIAKRHNNKKGGEDEQKPGKKKCKNNQLPRGNGKGLVWKGSMT